MMKLLRPAIVALIVVLSQVPALALTSTTTRGRVNDRSMEQFGGYTYRGVTRPSKRGDIVAFHFKRAGTNNWRRFKTGPADGRNAFFILDHNRPWDQINRRHRWSVFFTPGVRPGRWVLRAKYLRQHKRGSSAVRRWVRVRASD